MERDVFFLTESRSSALLAMPPVKLLKEMGTSLSAKSRTLSVLQLFSRDHFTMTSVLHS